MLLRRERCAKEDNMDWPMSRTVERQARRMTEIMERLDVDPAKLARERGGEAYAEARARCLQCSRAQECLLWLDGNLPGDQPTFCSNLALFERCKRTA
jgi:hypothetical protein